MAYSEAHVPWGLGRDHRCQYAAEEGVVSLLMRLLPPRFAPGLWCKAYPCNHWSAYDCYDCGDNAYCSQCRDMSGIACEASFEAAWVLTMLSAFSTISVVECVLQAATLLIARLGGDAGMPVAEQCALAIGTAHITLNRGVTYTAVNPLPVCRAGKAMPGVLKPVFCIVLY